MYLSDATIRELSGAQAGAAPLISPYDPELQNPCSYDLTLGKTLKRVTSDALVKPGNPKHIRYEERDISAEPVVIRPGDFWLATTNEVVSLPDNVAAQVVGKSSLGRYGLFVQNAGHIDPGFKGQITLELYNGGDVDLLMDNVRRICQIVFIPTDRPVERSYQGKYQDQRGVTESRGSE